MDEAIRTAFQRAINQQFDDAFFGPSPSSRTAAPPSPPLTLAALDAADAAITTDRRTLIVREIHPLRRAFAPHGWEVVRVEDEHGYWLRRRTGPAWRMKVYRSADLPKDVVYVVDPDAPTRPQVVALGAVLTTVTALALAGVDDQVGA